MTTALGAESGLNTARAAELTQVPLEQSTAHSPAVLEALELLHLVAYFGDPLILGRCPDRTAGNFFPIVPDSAGNGADSAHENP